MMGQTRFIVTPVVKERIASQARSKRICMDKFIPRLNVTTRMTSPSPYHSCIICIRELILTESVCKPGANVLLYKRTVLC